MFRSTLALLVLMGVAVAGCSSMFISSTPPPKFYQLQYQSTPVPCSRTSTEHIRIRNFTALSPYDRPEMVVIKAGNQVLFSSRYQWVASPGSMLADNLLRDFNLGSSIQAVSANSAVSAPMELTGQVYKFAWEEQNGSSIAELQVEVRLVDMQDKKGVLFRKSYDFKSQPSSDNSSEAFANAMSQIVGEFSEALRRDLCAAP